MATDPKGIYFAPNNQGFATILPDRRDPGMLDYVEHDMRQKAARNLQAEKARQKDLEKVKGFDTYRYYLPATNAMTNDLIGYVSQGEYDPSEFQRRVALYTQLSQAQMQMKDFDDVTFKEYDDDARINDTAKEAYINKFRNDSSVDGLMKAAKETPDKAWFVGETGGSEHINTSEAFKTAIDNTFSDWMATTKEGQAVLARYGYSINQFTVDQLKKKAKAFARYDEKTGSIVAKNPDELIQAGVLEAFQDDPFTNRIIEDQAIALQDARGQQGPVTDATRAEVLKDILDPYAQTGEVEDTKRITNVSDRVPYQAYGDAQRRNRAVDWVTDASRGEPTAWSFAEGGKYQGKTIIEAKPLANRKKVELVLGNPVAAGTEGAQEVKVPYRDQSGNVGYKTTYILPVETKNIDLTDTRRWNDEALLEFYRGNVRATQQPDYGEARAKKSRISKTGMFDNIGQ